MHAIKLLHAYSFLGGNVNIYGSIYDHERKATKQRIIWSEEELETVN